MPFPEETKTLILNGLKKFEGSQDYLNENLNIADLANKIGTNQKYLSFILNNVLERNFNQYTNELRIQYILDFLNENPENLTLSIKELAALSGFSTHSKFSKIFKEITGLAPKEYVKKLL